MSSGRHGSLGTRHQQLPRCLQFDVVSGAIDQCQRLMHAQLATGADLHTPIGSDGGEDFEVGGFVDDDVAIQRGCLRPQRVGQRVGTNGTSTLQQQI